MKVLIYYNENELKPVGGPSGYLYNLKKEIDDKKIDYVEFLEDDKENGLKAKVYNNLRKIYINKCPKKLKLMLPFYENKTFKKIFGKKEKKSSIDLNKYDIVHFHSALSMYMVKDSLKDYKGNVLFTTHCPKVSYKEILDNMISKNKYEKNKEKYDKLDIIDEYAFNRADYIHFPVKEAEECYYNTWPKYDEIHQKNKEKYYYIPTGIKNIEVREKREDIRKKYNIPEEAFVISYVGRHNNIKGYDNLKIIGEQILKSNKEVYFLIAGKEEPLVGIKNDHWIEIGWTNDPHSIINSSDLFILPNKETYFDLILLEVLSIGTPILMTETGGNKFFKKYNSESLMFYNNNYEAINTINDFIKTDIEERKKLCKVNKALFLENFTIDKFLDNYIEMLKYIERKNKQ
jgi:glycosyltransferase involved in cell wall biosynthesis